MFYIDMINLISFLNNESEIFKNAINIKTNKLNLNLENV